jgi:NAD(P)-dependent dehydrogenase (short-subunit alcohol dehydrogenase family)
MIALNLTAPFRMTRAVLPHMLERGSGVIINTISSAGLGGGRAGAGYTAAKHGVVGLTRNTAFVYGRRGIRAVGICPGYTRSGVAPQISTSDSETGPLLDGVAALSHRSGSPDELAAVFAFVASDAASYLNGAIIPVDGGWTAF